MAGPAPATLANDEERSAKAVHCNGWLSTPAASYPRLVKIPDERINRCEK